MQFVCPHLAHLWSVERSRLGSFLWASPSQASCKWRMLQTLDQNEPKLRILGGGWAKNYENCTPNYAEFQNFNDCHQCLCFPSTRPLYSLIMKCWTLFLRKKWLSCAVWFRKYTTDNLSLKCFLQASRSFLCTRKPRHGLRKQIHLLTCLTARSSKQSNASNKMEFSMDFWFHSSVSSVLLCIKHLQTLQTQHALLAPPLLQSLWTTSPEQRNKT